MKTPFVLSPRLYCVLAAFVVIAFCGTLGGCFGLAFTGRDIPDFAKEQLLALGGILAALLTGPHHGDDSSSGASTPDDATPPAQ